MAAGTGKRGYVAPKRYVTDTSTRYFYRGFYPKRYKHKNKRRETLCRRCDSTKQDCKVSERLLRGTQFANVVAGRRFGGWQPFSANEIFFSSVFSFHGIIVCGDLYWEAKRKLDSVRPDPCCNLYRSSDRSWCIWCSACVSREVKQRPEKDCTCDRIDSNQTKDCGERQT